MSNDNSIVNGDLHGGENDLCLDFLRKIVPATGFKFVTEWLVKPHHPRGGVMVHYPVADIDDMVDKVREIDSRHNNAYFAMATYKEVKHETIKTQRGDDFTYVVGRTQDNAQNVKSLWMDWDVGKSDAGMSYATRKEALAGVKAYVAATNLPDPMVVSSGYGLHTYWCFTDEIPTAEWERVACLQRVIMRHLQIKFDPSRDKDCSSILRPAGSHNYKAGKEPQLVKVLLNGAAPLPSQEYRRILQGYIEQNELTSQALVPSYMQGGTGNLADFGTADYPESFADIAAQHCNQLAEFSKTGGTSEPLWFVNLGLIKFFVDGEKWAHEWSAKHPEYDYAHTQMKMDQWSKGPTSCQTFKEKNPEGCASCTQKCTSPIQLGGETAPMQRNWLAEMNAQYAWIAKDAGIYRVQYRDFIAMDRFHAAHANDVLEITTRKTNKDVSVSRMWLADKGRSQFKAIVTRPGEAQATADNCLNDWAGYTCEPLPGDVEPFKNLYDYMFGVERYPLLWLAHLIQFPGRKMFVALVIWSLREGVGKNLLFETIGALFSPYHFSLISQSEVDDDFCGWIPGTVFMLGDEIRASKSEKSRDRLKLWTTGTTLRTHDKGQPKRVVDNLMNQVYLSNHTDGMFLSDHDRRFYVHEIKAAPLPEALKQEFLRWRDNGGLPHLLHHLNCVGLTDFDPKGRAPETESKREMIEAGRSDLDRWALDVVSGALPVGKEVATADDLTRRFNLEHPHLRTSPSVSTVGKVFVRMGAYRPDNQVRLSNGRKVRALALVRTDFWKLQPESVWRSELEKRA